MPENNNINEQETEKRHLTSAERQKLYQEKATQRRIEEYRKRRKARMIKISLIVLACLIIIGAVIAIVMLEKNVWKPARIYESANELYAAEEYLDAYDVYLSLGDYKDAAEIASTCITKNAQKLSGRDDVIIGTTASMPWFKIDEVGAITFDGDKYSGPAELVVPDVFNNELVTAVADKGFFYAKNLDTVIIPASVRRLESQAFFAASIKAIVIPDEVSFIGEKAFEDCVSLVSVTLPTKLKEIGSASFRNCNELVSLCFPEGFTTIGARAVASCEKLESLSFPSTLEAIGSKAFEGCEKLTSVTFNGTRDTFTSLCSGEGNDILLKVKELNCK